MTYSFAELDEGDWLLKVSNLSKTFRVHLLGGMTATACQEITFSVRIGEALGIQGPSGSGKSTILRCIYRTCLPTSGEILYRSNRGTVDLARTDERTILMLRREEISYVSQFLRVIPRVSALDVVSQGLRRKGYAMEEALNRARLLLSRLGIPPSLWNAFPSTFSGGEQQRVNVARAIAAEPRLILLDEPTASLDADSKGMMIKLLLELKARGMAILLVSHDMKALKRVSDRIFCLSKGKAQDYEEAETKYV
ncbi:MAG: alpha-D-ribose 1-methylphosphonate 5-triphosphate synthase subunit PhnL [Synergistaceae bacterium]|nr:alpha-D-ribose 1-methylphosphonate 5-triphosphate synthase subunit PhnL [Synergistaceae bacterium]